MYYLVANNHEWSGHIPANPNDTIVHFNLAVHWPKLHTIRCKHALFVRESYEGTHHGLKGPNIDDILHSDRLTGVFSYKTLHKSLTDRCSNAKPVGDVVSQYTQGMYPSSGYVMIQACLDWGEMPTLVGFTHLYGGYDMHDWHFEKVMCDSLRLSRI